MSAQCGKLISLILYEHFGEVVEKVGYHLFKSGLCPLWPIVKYTELPVPQVSPSQIFIFLFVSKLIDILGEVSFMYTYQIWVSFV